MCSSDLVKTREEIKSLQDNHVSIINALKQQHEDVVKKLNEKIEYLQLTPAKRKKVDEENKPKEVVEESTTLPLEEPQDGGSF